MATAKTTSDTTSELAEHRRNKKLNRRSDCGVQIQHAAANQQPELRCDVRSLNGRSRDRRMYNTRAVGTRANFVDASMPTDKRRSPIKGHP
jgi:hypothetical protein